MKKDVEKNLEKEKKELKALEKMKGLAVTNSKMGNPESFQGQILECQKRIQDHERKIAQVDSWLGLEPQLPSQGIVIVINPHRCYVHMHEHVKKTHSAIRMHNIEVSRLGDIDPKWLLEILVIPYFA